MLIGAVLPGSCKEIQTELVIPQSDLTWLESGANQHGPKIAFVVIHFVIVDLYLRTESEPECGQLEESLSTHVGTFTNSNPECLSRRHADWMTNCGSAMWFQYRDEHDDVHTFAFEVWQRSFDCPLMECKFLQRLQLRRDLKIHSDASL